MKTLATLLALAVAASLVAAVPSDYRDCGNIESPLCAKRSIAFHDYDRMANVSREDIGPCQPTCTNSDKCFIPRGVPDRIFHPNGLDAGYPMFRVPCPGCTPGVDDYYPEWSGPTDLRERCELGPNCIPHYVLPCDPKSELCELRVIGKNVPCVTGPNCVWHFKNSKGHNPNIPGNEAMKPAHCDPATDLSCEWLSFSNPESTIGEAWSGHGCRITCHDKGTCLEEEGSLMARSQQADVNPRSNFDQSLTNIKFFHDNRRVDTISGRTAGERANDFIWFWLEMTGNGIPAPIPSMYLWDGPHWSGRLMRHIVMAVPPLPCCRGLEMNGIPQCVRPNCKSACYVGWNCTPALADPEEDGHWCDLHQNLGHNHRTEWDGHNLSVGVTYVKCPKIWGDVIICDHPDHEWCWHEDYIQYALSHNGVGKEIKEMENNGRTCLHPQQNTALE
ncbi:hypothetical protein QOT17_001343 [Balamuthia mandrillaris]